MSISYAFVKTVPDKYGSIKIKVNMSFAKTLKYLKIKQKLLKMADLQQALSMT